MSPINDNDKKADNDTRSSNRNHTAQDAPGIPPEPDILGKPEAGETLVEVGRFEAPFQREIKLHAVAHDSGLKMLRLNIRERRRFTVLDIDAKTARHWAKLMAEWADSVS